MDDFDGPFEPLHQVEQRKNVRIILDDSRKPEDRPPITIRIIFRGKEEAQVEPETPLVRVIHEDELAQMMEAHDADDFREEESMSFGESVTLLIAIGVLIYLVYALLWPERF